MAAGSPAEAVVVAVAAAAEMMEPKHMPFDARRMLRGGFKQMIVL